MKKAVLFTASPDRYSHVLEHTTCPCNIFTETAQLERYLYAYHPALVLIETESVVNNDSRLFYNLNERLPYRPVIIFAEHAELYRMLEHDFHQKSDNTPEELPDSIDATLDKELKHLHFSPALRGYLYLKQALYFEHLHSHSISYLKKDIYEAVSRRYNTSVPSVERNMRFAIQKAYRQQPSTFAGLFPELTKPPGNLTFLKTFHLYLKQNKLL